MSELDEMGVSHPLCCTRPAACAMLVDRFTVYELHNSLSRLRSPRARLIKQGYAQMVKLEGGGRRSRDCIATWLIKVSRYVGIWGCCPSPSISLVAIASREKIKHQQRLLWTDAESLQQAGANITGVGMCSSSAGKKPSTETID